MNNKTLQTIKRLLDTPKNIVVIPHQNPDGDAMGSTLALAIFLKKLGHKATVITPNDYPKFLKWMPQSDEVVFFDRDNDKANDLLKLADIVFILDFNSLERTGKAMAKVLESIETTFVMIDHHQKPDPITELMYSDISICSTSQMVYHFIEKLGELDKIESSVATCLYTGIMTDTGSFQYNLTTSTTHRVVASLIDKGAKNNEIHDKVYNTNSYQRLQLLGNVLKNIKILPQYRTVYMYLSEADKKLCNFKKGDSEGFVNYALSVEDTVLATIFIEDNNLGIIKMSFRSKGDFSVNDFARTHFNGGGHINAAGGRSEDTLEATIAKFLEILPQYKPDLNP